MGQQSRLESSLFSRKQNMFRCLAVSCTNIPMQKFPPNTSAAHRPMHLFMKTHIAFCTPEQFRAGHSLRDSYSRQFVLLSGSWTSCFVFCIKLIFGSWTLVSIRAWMCYTNGSFQLLSVLFRPWGRCVSAHEERGEGHNGTLVRQHSSALADLFVTGKLGLVFTQLYLFQCHWYAALFLRSIQNY